MALSRRSYFLLAFVPNNERVLPCHLFDHRSWGEHTRSKRGLTISSRLTVFIMRSLNQEERLSRHQRLTDPSRHNTTWILYPSSYYILDDSDVWCILAEWWIAAETTLSDLDLSPGINRIFIKLLTPRQNKNSHLQWKRKCTMRVLNNC